ncbi:lytic polysaccharide monooxygenase auxiliary activity family 9 protein [Kitasatospora sp. NPDC085879]|uniref:lytic polysaccharide monooxygenase auxiliary activity family 9 protein n=1 Tax=Kitasatospora sp. NPDC085879 TaxID=3154769 RepID=UPI003415517B
MDIMHGAVSSPPSRAQLYLESWQANGLEAGKFFPAAQAGLADPFAPDDIRNVQPPADGKIASAGKDFAAPLDAVDTDWKKHQVTSGQNLEITWGFHAEHKTRRFNYFLTKNGWDPNQPLTRAQFEPKPFHSVQLAEQPYWEHQLNPGNPVTHTLRLPQRNAGHQVLLAVWEVADTGNAFYQVIDLQCT